MKQGLDGEGLDKGGVDERGVGWRGIGQGKGWMERIERERGWMERDWITERLDESGVDEFEREGVE